MSESTALPRQAAAPVQDEPARRRGALAAGFGTFIEGYDLSVYGYTAIYIAPLFFPGADPTAALLLALGVFALAYVARPLGGLLFGYWGDRVGRRVVLLTTVISMGAATSLIAVLPPYSAIGIAAPALLLVARLVQGASVGGEVAGATSYVTELSRPGERARLGSFNPMGASLGFAFAAAVTGTVSALTTTEQMASWGWRIPFLVAVPLTLLCYWGRRKLAHEAAQPSGAPAARGRVAELFGSALGPFVLVVLIAIAVNATAYIGFTYMSIHLINVLGFPATPVFWTTTVVVLVSALAMPYAGRLGDRIGLPKLATIGLVGYAVIAVPAMLLMGAGSIWLAGLAFLVFVLNASSLQVAGYTMLPLMFDRGIRATGMGLGYSLGAVIAGGTAPVVSRWLVESTGWAYSPGLLVIGVCVVALVAVALAAPRLRAVERSAP
jgi:MFS transporter, MHS family, proline/betaine transporter